MNTNPQVGGCDAEAREVACPPQQCHPVQHQGAESNHDDHTKLAVQAPSRAADQQEDQGGLSGDGIVVVPLSQSNVEADQGQQSHAEA